MLAVKFVAWGPGHLLGKTTLWRDHHGHIQRGCIVHRPIKGEKLPREKLHRSLFDGYHLDVIFTEVEKTGKKITRCGNEVDMIPKGVEMHAIPI